MNCQLEGLVEVLRKEIEEILTNKDAKVSFNGKRVVITIDKEGIKTKIIIPIVRRKKPPRLAPEFIKKIQEVKRVLKGKRDAIYLFTLLMSLHSELSKVNGVIWNEESRKVFTPAIEILKKDLEKIKLLEVK